MTILEICDHLQSLIDGLHEESKSTQWEWGATAPQNDEQHVEDFKISLRKTREHFGLEGPQPLHGCYVQGTDTVLCHTGTSPTAGHRARFIASTDPQLIKILIDYVRSKEAVE